MGRKKKPSNNIEVAKAIVELLAGLTAIAKTIYDMIKG